MLFLSIRHRINFSQLTRHSDRYCDRSMRLHFEQYVDFAAINRELIHGSVSTARATSCLLSTRPTCPRAVGRRPAWAATGRAAPRKPLGFGGQPAVSHRR